MLGKKILAVLMSLTMCISAITANVNIGVKAVESSTRVQEIMANMSVRQKITQMLMPDFRKWSSDGSAAADFTVMNDQVSKIIEDYDFGGLILFANNVKGTEQSLNLTKAMQEAATKDGGTPLLLGIDQEGGIVYRLGSGSAMPGNMAVGATYTEHGTKYAKMAGQIIGRELAALGINTNFAPTVDVNNNANNPVIGLRSFGDDPQMVAELSVAMIEGMNEYNIITSAKHFPGHGDTATDSHTGLPVVDKSLEELMQCELVPFQAAMDAGTDMFMVAHIAYPQVDPTTANGYVIPATVSKTILTDLVRDTMNYDGVLITDAMNMAGLANLFTQQEAAVKAIQAGNDILLMPCQLYNNTTDLANLDSIIAAIETAVANGEITEERLDESVERILKLKEKRGILDYDAEDYTLENAEAQVGSQQNRDEEREIAAAAVTVVRNEENVLPLQPKTGEKVLFLGAYNNELPGMDLGFRRVQDADLAQGVTYETYRYSSSTSEATLRGKIEAADYVVCISEIGSAANAKPTSWVTSKPTLVSQIADELGKDCVILSISKPYDVQAYPLADAMVAVYGNKGMDPTEGLTPDAAFGPNITAGVEVIFGGFEATGTLPVNIPRFTENYTYDHDDIVYNRGFGIKYEANTHEAKAERIVATMSVRDKITQMLMPDFRKWTLNVNESAAEDFTVMNDEVAKIIEDYNFGGVILFANNVKGTEQSLNLTKAMQEAAMKDGGLPLLLGIDQEGGIVYRLGSGSAMPGNMAVGATYTEYGTKYAKMAGQIIGRELAALGINTNFAPTVDVNNNANNPVIGLRSFGDDPQMVAELSVAMIEGMNEYNIITSAKHFPGHGDTATDSHSGLPVVDKSLEELMQCELVPFQAAMDAGTDMFMVAHIAYPQVDPTTANGSVIPATVSKTILTDLVRNTMNYDGVLITDAMNMEGLAGLFSQTEAAVKAIQAGNDILLMPCVLYDDEEDIKDLDAIIAAIETAVANGEITEERLDESCKRILTLKSKRGILDYDASKYTLENAEAQVGSQQNRDEEREIAAAAVTVVRNEENVLPLQPKAGEKVLFLGAYANELPGMDLGFRRVQDAGLAKGVTYETYRYSSSTSEATLRSKIEAADYVVCISEVGSIANAKPTHWVTAKPALVTSIANELGKKVVILSISKPYDVQAHPTADAMVAVYGNKGMDPTEALTPDAAFGPNITAGVEVIFGGFEATGTLPVNIPKFTDAYTYDHEDIVYERGFGLTYEKVEPVPLTRVEKIMNSMSVRDKITQMLMPDFRKWSSDGSAAADFTVMNDQVAKIIEDYNFGGLILFANNVKGTEQSLNLTKAMQEAATKDGGTPLLLGIDQEGGIVYRLGSGSAMPGNMAVGATYTEHGTKYAKMAGQIIGRELAALGINTNFAPTVDVNNNANNPVIGLRSFGDDPQMVAELSVAMIEGMNEYNIITSAKHFPGHGDTATDSHTGLPVVDKSLEDLMQCELVPFQAAMDAGTDMFMVAHIAYPQVDPTTANGYVIPATVSKTILTDLVRDTMNYDGVLITDAMNMAGLANLFTQQEAAVKAIQAGNDILLMPCQLYNNTTDLANLDSIIAAIETAVANGEITEERLNESVKRILDLKEKRGILDYDASKYTLENAEAQVGSQQNRDEEREIAAAAVTVVRNEENVLPLQPKAGEKVLFLGAYANELPGMDLGFRRVQDAGLAKGVTYETYRYSSSTSEATLRSKIEAADYVVCISEVGSAANAKPTHWVTAKPALVTSIANELGKKVVILSISKPYDVQAHPTADAMVAVYGNKGMDPTEALTPDAAFGPNITAGVEVIFGGFEATGTLPVNIPRFTENYTYDHDDIVYNRGFGLKYSSLPAAATNVKAESVDYKTIKLTWDAVEDATSYIVERKVSDTDKWMLVGATTEPTYTVENVKTGKEYTYRVQTVNGKVKGAYSVDFVGKAELTGEVTLTIAPNGSDKFDLSWTQVDGATRYIIYRKSGEGEWQKLLTLGKDATTYTTKAMLPGTYSYMVKAGRYDSVDRVMTEGSNVVEGVATKDTPTITIEKGEGDNVTISWSKVEGMKGYDVYRATTIDGKYTQLKRTTSTSITTTIKAGKTYFYKVRGFDVVNDVKVYSTYSETVSYTAN